MKRILSSLLLIMLLFAVKVFSQYLNITPVGQLGRASYSDVFIRGDYAFCAADSRGVDIFDISDPSSPVKVGSFMTTGYAKAIHVSGNYAYVAGGDLEVFDVSNPTAPVRGGIVDTYGTSTCIYVSGNYAYLGAGSRGLQVIDVSDPSSPALVGEYPVTHDQEAIFVRGKYAYFLHSQYLPGRHTNDAGIQGTNTAYLTILDISNPASPTKVRWYQVEYWWWEVSDIYVKGDYAYLLGNVDLRILDISDPANPFRVGKYETGGNSVFIDASGDYAYVAAGGEGLRVVDISNPSNPTLAGNFDNLDNALGIHVDSPNNYAYVADSTGGLKVLDISIPSTPSLQGSIKNTGPVQAEKIHINGNYAYITDGYSYSWYEDYYTTRLYVVDISNPSNPLIIGNYEKEDHIPDKVLSAGHYVYLIYRWIEVLEILDVSDPTSPTLVGTYQIPREVTGIDVDGQYAYLASKYVGLLVLDVSNPSTITQAGLYETEGYVIDVDVSGNYAYAACERRGLKILNISDPSAITFTGGCNVPEDIDGIHVNGNYAYGISNRHGLYVFDISDPSSPVLKGEYNTPFVYDVFVSGDYAFLVAGNNGLDVLDISAPDAPTSVGKYFSTNAWGVYARGNYIYLASTDLLIFTYDKTALTLPQMTLSRGEMHFVSGAMGSQSMFITNSGGGNLNWTAKRSENWLRCSPSYGNAGGKIFISVDPFVLSPGTYRGSVSFSSPFASNSPQTLTVTATVYEPGQTAGPFGVFATPSDNAVVNGSVPVTGWALDDVGVESVKIYREQGQDLVYIGNAVFVAGARPDVETAYPGYPNNSKAGWGYMMLTNLLPDGGNGVFTLHAIAEDLEGNRVTLGTKTVTCSNIDAVKPFGTIDAPAQGGTASGSGFANWGWVLTPQPNTIPTDGSTINVWVDGVNQGCPVYNIYKDDIAGLFPNYNNSNGAVGYLYLDTTPYENGVHTIQWTASDDAGNADGIGSRYFTIQNLAGPPRQGSNHTWDVISRIPVDYLGPVKIKKGGNTIESQTLYPDDKGKITIEIRELEKIAIDIDDGSKFFAGYLVAGNRLKSLPVGSTVKNGIFYWGPGPGFFDEYRLLFVIKDQNGELNRKEILVRITPKLTAD